MPNNNVVDGRVADWLGVLNEKTLEMIEYVVWCQNNIGHAYASDIVNFIAPEIKQEGQPTLYDYLGQRDSYVKFGWIINLDGIPTWYNIYDDLPIEVRYGDSTKKELACRIISEKLKDVTQTLKDRGYL